MAMDIERKIFELAYKGGQLSDFLVGAGPYALGGMQHCVVINTGAIMHRLYTYHTEEPDANVPAEFHKAMMQLTQYRSFLSTYVVMDLTAHHLHMLREGKATFTVDCAGILDALRLHIEENGHFYSQPGELDGYQLPRGMKAMVSSFKDDFQRYGIDFDPVF